MLSIPFFKLEPAALPLDEPVRERVCVISPYTKTQPFLAFQEKQARRKSLALKGKSLSVGDLCSRLQESYMIQRVMEKRKKLNTK